MPTQATPTFSPVAGTYSATQKVTITSSGADYIYYTLDGSIPTAGSAVYSSPVSVVQSLTLKALAVKAGYTNSAIGSAAYIIIVYSVPDCRDYGVFPNLSRTVQLTKIFDVPAHPSVTPPTDSRAHTPVDSRATADIPENSRTGGTFGPGE